MHDARVVGTEPAAADWDLDLDTGETSSPDPRLGADLHWDASHLFIGGDVTLGENATVEASGNILTPSYAEASTITGNSRITGEVFVTGSLHLGDRACVMDSVITGTATLVEDAVVSDSEVAGAAGLRGYSEITSSHVIGTVTLDGPCHLHEFSGVGAFAYSSDTELLFVTGTYAGSGGDL